MATPRDNETIRLIAIGAIVCLMFGCDREQTSPSASSLESTSEPASASAPSPEPTPTESEPDPEPVTFEVDGDGVEYLVLGPDGERQAVGALEEIPVAARGAVGVSLPEETAEGRLDGTMPVAGLYGAKPGDRVEAEPRSFRAFERGAEAGRRGGRWAVAVSRRARRVVASTTDRKSSSLGGRAGGSSDGSSSDNGEIVIESTGELMAESAGAQGFTGSDGAGGFRRVVVYGTNWCPYCMKAKAWLRANDVSFRWRNTEKSSDAKRAMKKLCERKGLETDSIPTIHVKPVDGRGGGVMQGWRPDRMRAMLSDQ